MTYADAVRILAARAHLANLEAALRVVGYRLDRRAYLGGTSAHEAELQVDTGVAGQGDSSDDELAESWLHPLDQEWGEPFADDDPSTEEIGWDWGREDQLTRDEWVRVGRNGGLVPYVLPSEEIPGQATAEDRIDSVERPRSAEELAELLRARIMRYADTWNARQAQELLLRKVPGDRIDVEKLVRLLAEGKPVREVPLLHRTKIALPIQIVHDIGLFAGPFGYDLQAFLNVMLLWGSPGREQISFRHALADGCGAGPIWQWEEYRIPRRATAVVFVSGLYGPDPRRRVSEFEHLMAILTRQL